MMPRVTLHACGSDILENKTQTVAFSPILDNGSVNNATIIGQSSPD